MKILAIDTTGLVASSAIVDEEKTIVEFTTNFKKTHSETLMPMIENMFKMLNMNILDIDYIACSSGPGSFTGLRIGVATAKGLAFGANKKIIPVPTLDAMAYNIFNNDSIIVPIMDARRNQAYTSFYTWENNVFMRLTDYYALDINQIISLLETYNKKILFLGDGVPIFHKTIEKSSLNFEFVLPHLNMQRASSVGSIALKMLKEEKVIESEQFIPFYLRKSQAEREYEEKQHIK